MLEICVVFANTMLLKGKWKSNIVTELEALEYELHITNFVYTLVNSHETLLPHWMKWLLELHALVECWVVRCKS